MSSFFGHAAVGVAIFLAHSKERNVHPWWALPLLVFLALSPDLDYFLYWTLGFEPAPRITHSLLFCLLLSGLVWLCIAPLRKPVHTSLLPLTLVFASTSHLLLDLSVGVHSLPLLWPFSLHEISSPIGLLPSAGYPRLSNHYLWRNLLIECGVLFPLLAFFVALKRRGAMRFTWLPIFIFLFWAGCLAWSISLSR